MFGHGGGKPIGKEGEIKITPETNSLFKVCLIPPPAERNMHICAQMRQTGRC